MIIVQNSFAKTKGVPVLTHLLYILYNFRKLRLLQLKWSKLHFFLVDSTKSGK